MELRATMELGGRTGSQIGEEDSPYIVEEQIQLLSTNSAYEARYVGERSNFKKFPTHTQDHGDA